MTGELSPGRQVPETLLSPDVYHEFKMKMAEHPNADVRDAFDILSIFEARLVFMHDEFNTVMRDYQLEVARCNELHKNLLKTIKLLKTARGEE